MIRPKRIAWFLAVLLLEASSQTDAYHTWVSAVPTKKQIPWLEKLTVDICESPGSLSEEMIREAPQIMEGWARSEKKGSKNALAMERLLKRRVDEVAAGGDPRAAPSTKDYNCLLEGWAHSGEGVFAAERCEQILSEMQRQYAEEGDQRVQPSLASFQLAIIAWRESGVSYRGLRAQRLLQWMIELYRGHQNDLVLPNSACYDIVLHIWARSGHPQAAQYAEKLLGSMERLHQETTSDRIQPSTLSFNAVLSAWSRSPPESDNGETSSWKRSLEILAFMEQLHLVEDHPLVVPDLISYHTVLGTLARKGDPAKSAPKAESILRSVEERCRNGTIDWRPDAIVYNTAIGLWQRSRRSGAFRKARSLLDRQLNFYAEGSQECKPDVVSFTSVLASCAAECGNADEKRKAFNVALSTFQQLSARQEEFGEPNHVTYGTMMKACARLLPHGDPLRKKWAKQLFEECASKGMVGGMVLSRLREATPNEVFYELLEGHPKNRLPEAWTRNVQEKNPYRRGKQTARRRASV